MTVKAIYWDFFREPSINVCFIEFIVYILAD